MDLSWLQSRLTDGSYGDQSVLANRQAFLDDLGDVVDTGYWQNQMFVKNVHLTNFFYMTTAGTVAVQKVKMVNGVIDFPATVDFHGVRMLTPGPQGFPPAAFSPGPGHSNGSARRMPC